MTSSNSSASPGNNLNVPQFSTPPITQDPQTGALNWNPAWWRFLLQLFARTGGTNGQDPTEVEYAELMARRTPVDGGLEARLRGLEDEVAYLRSRRRPRLTTTTTTYPPYSLIQPWNQGYSTVPTGWAICDGSTPSIPDMSDVFPVGAGTFYAQGSYGGSRTIAANQLPAHTHTYNDSTAVLAFYSTGGASTAAAVASLALNAQPTDPNTPSGIEFDPPYYALMYIINTVAYTVINDITFED